MHFEKGKTPPRRRRHRAPATSSIRLAQLAATELELTVKLDPTNQFAAVELGKVRAPHPGHAAALSGDKNSIEEMKKRAKTSPRRSRRSSIPPPNEPISLSFPHETPVKDIYRALGNAFGINILFDQAVKDDRIAIELKDVTAQQALERVMQAANHFYKVLDEHTIIVVPDNPQARRDYEDLVIRTFYLSNGDAEQVTNVVRTMIEARNVFPLKALNAITIRDTADKVRIAEKIIEANDKAKAEVVVDVELLQIDLDKTRDIGCAVHELLARRAVTRVGRQPTPPASRSVPRSPAAPTANRQPRRSTTCATSASDSFSFTDAVADVRLHQVGRRTPSCSPIPSCASPRARRRRCTSASASRFRCRRSTRITAAHDRRRPFAPVTSYQYQDVGIKVAIEPRVHHNREVTLKLTVEVSNLGAQRDRRPRPAGSRSFATRTIESTIRLKDGETNFLAGLIQRRTQNTDTQDPVPRRHPDPRPPLHRTSKHARRTDLVLTMTPHIVRIPDITEDDVAPMWVGTQNNLTFRGVSPRIESQAGGDPFTCSRRRRRIQVAPDGEPA